LAYLRFSTVFYWLSVVKSQHLRLRRRLVRLASSELYPTGSNGEGPDFLRFSEDGGSWCFFLFVFNVIMVSIWEAESDSGIIRWSSRHQLRCFFKGRFVPWNQVWRILETWVGFGQSLKPRKPQVSDGFCFFSDHPVFGVSNSDTHTHHF
jgi:hypothetical protein